MTGRQQRVLLLGGTRYVGRRLAALLLEQGHEVTIMTRGRAADPFGERVRRVVADRFDRSSLERGLAGERWDAVYDFLCYAPFDATDSCALLAGRAGRYICISSQAVYGAGEDLPEAAYDPAGVEISYGRRDDFSYAEGKRLAEAVLFRQATFPVVAVRFPIILGPDDYSRRLHQELGRVRQGQPLQLANHQARMALISSSEAAELLLWLLGHELDGPLNAASRGALTPAQLVALIEQALGREATLLDQPGEDPFGLFATPETLTLDCGRAERAGYSFAPVERWLEPLIEELAAGLA